MPLWVLLSVSREHRQPRVRCIGVPAGYFSSPLSALGRSAVGMVRWQPPWLVGPEVRFAQASWRLSEGGAGDGGDEDGGNDAGWGR